MNLAKKGQFYFSFFKVDSQNPKFNLEYLICILCICLTDWVLSDNNCRNTVPLWSLVRNSIVSGLLPENKRMLETKAKLKYLFLVNWLCLIFPWPSGCKSSQWSWWKIYKNQVAIVQFNQQNDLRIKNIYKAVYVQLTKLSSKEERLRNLFKNF